MSDPSADALERLQGSFDRLELVLQRDAKLGERIASLEGLPREIGEFRRRIESLERSRLTKEQVADVIRLALADEREKHPKKLDSGSQTNIRVAKINTMPLMITAISGAALAALSLVIQVIRGG